MVDDHAALEAFLDDEPWCVLTRLALADLYLDLGSEAWSRYYRWSALAAKWPYHAHDGTWFWFEEPSRAMSKPQMNLNAFLPKSWCRKLGFERRLFHESRRAVEEFLWRGVWGGEGPPQGLIDGLLAVTS